ncbi:hypothetical protein AL01_09335 [Bombella intestini]|uniref:ABC transporter domain-containing protein n=1 Tax=Bombella intestini TaxID=1539051 RepID=A0A1S8GN00_9PROT|nr:ATP-binding cassette domain-containing protein [Bombella intestini]OOL17004.1 hypothetical protein AL01_09335 [Bombella intestini]
MITLEMLPLPAGTSLVPGGVQLVSLQLERGKTLWVTGPAEAGKTALLETIALRRPVADGAMTLLNQDAGPRITCRTRKLLQQRIGYIEAAPLFMDRLTVADNIALPLEMNHASKADIRRETESILQWFALEDHARSYPATLSQTARLRAACARALIAQPSIVLVDEPALTLCAGLRNHLLSTIRGLARNGTTALLATQTLPEEASLEGDILNLPQHKPSPENTDPSVPEEGVAAPRILVTKDERLLP